MNQFSKPLFKLAILFALTGFAAAGSAPAQTKSDWQAPEDAKKTKNPVPASAAALAAGKIVYAEKCASCHGDNGNGQGDQAKLYSVKPQDFTDAHLMSQMTDGELFWKMSEGRRPMPGFKKQLTDEQRWQVVGYIRTFVKRSDASSGHTPPHK